MRENEEAKDIDGQSHKDYNSLIFAVIWLAMKVSTAGKTIALQTFTMHAGNNPTCKKNIKNTIFLNTGLSWIVPDQHVHSCSTKTANETD